MFFVFILSTSYSIIALPVDDDFCKPGGAAIGDIGVLESVLDRYENWTGRWAVSTIYAAFYPIIDRNSVLFNLLLLLSPIIWIIIFYLVLKRFFGGELSIKQRFIGAGVFVALYWVGMPDPGDTWYWLVGSTEYQIPFLLMIIALAIMTSEWILKETGWKSVFVVATAMLLMLVVAGLHEMVGIVSLGLFLAGTLLMLAKNQLRLGALFGIVAAASMVGVLINISAPGLEVRQATSFENGASPVAGIRYMISPRTSPIGWLGDPRLLTLSALLLTSTSFVRLAGKQTWATWKLQIVALPSFFTQLAFLVPLTGIACVASMAALAAYGTGSDAPPRIMNLAYALFVIFWMGSLICVASHLSKLGNIEGQIARVMNLSAAILFPTSLIIAPNTVYGATELPMAVTSWHPKTIERFENIQSLVAAGERNLVVSAIEDDPRLLRSWDLSSTPEFYANSCMANYYGADELVVDWNSRTDPKSDPLTN